MPEPHERRTDAHADTAALQKPPCLIATLVLPARSARPACLRLSRIRLVRLRSRCFLRLEVLHCLT
ncbi:hypothetical protein OCAR_5993 [Afipia carboxidovorans OM5]|nr:hypothetical protein OCAR_5993 [Afipia carboxidovorans OM5]